MAEGRKANIFGIRHLSPAGAHYVREFFDQVQPQLILIEGPSDFSEMLPFLTDKQVKPPVAIMAYTKEAPIRTVLYPFAEYSPEYQAALWAKEHGCQCRFMDLPSGVVLALEEIEEPIQKEMVANGQKEKETAEGAESQTETEYQEKTDYQNDTECREETDFQAEAKYQGKMDPVSYIYHRLDQVCGEETHETFWEHVLEQAADEEAYRKGVALFGENIRFLSMEKAKEEGLKKGSYKNRLREAYMCYIIDQAAAEVPMEKIAVVTGAFHVIGLTEGKAMEEKEVEKLPCMEAMTTMMPYSYYRLSMRAGYGAGNCAPAYYELLWKGFCRGKPELAVYEYLARIAEFLRNSGNPVSSASVIEAVRLSAALAQLHGYQIPALKDLRDGAVTCIGHGRFSEIALGVADTETGTKIGSLPEGMSQTSVQTDFYQKLEELRLTKYKSVILQDLQLDLREKLNVKSKKAALIDLERSFFLHQLRILQIRFAKQESISQEKATWGELWHLQWTPEAEIQLVETVLKGDTIRQAASFVLKEEAEGTEKIGQVAHVIEEAYCCGMPEAAEYGRKTLQQLAVDAASVEEISQAAESLSLSVSYGDIRHLDASFLIPVLDQLFLRACLILPESCSCDDQGAKDVMSGMERLNRLVRDQEFIDEERWVKVLYEIAKRDDLNTKLSGLAAAMLLERGRMDNVSLGMEVERRLSKGMPADLGAGWFEGLAMKNHFALIARMSLWESLSGYLDSLDDQEFKRALVFLRRAFADFSSAEKNSIAENFGEIWQINPRQVSEILNDNLSEGELELLADLADFDFDL
ncbi:MAG: hypothetical protein HFG49_00560 [Lachnospiraceae bacterium]|jgi:hypothetical protein|nr:hypothetical protein [Lachnospiraceae bacterium]